MSIRTSSQNLTLARLELNSLNRSLIAIDARIIQLEALYRSGSLVGPAGPQGPPGDAALAGVTGPEYTKTGYIPQWSFNIRELVNGLLLVTVVGDPGSDNSVPTEAAVRALVGGFVTGPASSVPNTVPTFADATGKVLQDTLLYVDADGNICDSEGNVVIEPLGDEGVTAYGQLRIVRASSGQVDAVSVVKIVPTDASNSGTITGFEVDLSGVAGPSNTMRLRGGEIYVFADYGQTLYLLGYVDSTAGPKFSATKARGTEAVPAAAKSGDYIFQLIGRAQWGTSSGNRTQTARIDYVATEDQDATHKGAKMVFNVIPTGSTTLTDILEIQGTKVLSSQDYDCASGKKYLINGVQHRHSEDDLDFTDVTTLDASTSKHGLVVKAVAPASGLLNVVGIGNGETAYTNKAMFDSTNPAMNGVAGPGTSTLASRNDHVHPVDTSRAPLDSPTFTTRFGGGAGVDVFPAADARGIATRLTNRLGISTYTDHFRSGSIPSGFAWAGSPFITGDILDYDARSDFLETGITSGGSGRSFLYKAITNAEASWSNKHVSARCRAGNTGKVGIRVDDGSDDNYFEFYLKGTGTQQTLHTNIRAGGGSETESSALLAMPQTELLTLQLYVNKYGSDWYIQPYVVSEDGGSIYGALNAIAWAPASGRQGLMLRYLANYDAGVFDWFYYTFT